MSKKKKVDQEHSKGEQEIINPQADPETMEYPAEGEDVLNPVNQQFLSETQKFKDEISALNNKYLRLYSDFDNYRKRTLKERAETLKTASAGLITQLLPVLDDFDRAVRSLETTTEVAPLKEGIELIHAKFRKILAQKGLEEIHSLGEPFDTDLHEAITSFPAADESMKGRIVEEIEKGYTLNGTVIRFARVAVAN